MDANRNANVFRSLARAGIAATLLTNVAGAQESAHQAASGPDIPKTTPFRAHSEQGQLNFLPYAPGGDGPSTGAGFVITQLAAGVSDARTAAGRAQGGYLPHLYAVADEGTRLVSIDPTGLVTHIASLGEASTSGRGLTPAFDVLQRNGGGLFVATEANRIHRTLPDGTLVPFAHSTHNNFEDLSIAIDPYGDFGGRMFAAGPGGHGVLYRISEGGGFVPFATGIGPSPNGLTFTAGGEFGVSLYVSDATEATLHRVDWTHVAGGPAERWIDLSVIGAATSPGDVVVSHGGVFGADVMYVADEDTGRVSMVSAWGEYLGALVTGLPKGISLELVSYGSFAGSLVVAAGPDVWVIQPRCAADWDQNGIVNAADIGAFASDYFNDISMGTLRADYDGNGVTNAADMAAILTEYASTPSTCTR